jgi:hypothetical protein
MNLLRAVLETFRSRRVWIWQIAGIIIYLIPVGIRFATRSVAIPILNFPGFRIDHIIPGNFLEKLLVNAFFPGGAGGVTGEVFVTRIKGSALKRKTKYLSRFVGALGQTAVWSAFQYWGYSLMISGPYGSNLFEHAIVFPINFTLAALSIFTPDFLNFMRRKLAGLSWLFSRK